MIINAGTISLLTQQFAGDFKRGLSSKADSFYQQISMETRSGSASNHYGFMGSVPKIREWLDDRQIKNIEQHGYDLPNKDWEDTVGVKRNDILDDQHGIYSPIMEELGGAVASFKDEEFTETIKTSQTLLGYDGQPFFNGSHPKRDGTTQSNLDSGGAAPYWILMDLRRSVKPFIYQNRQNFNMVSLTNLNDSNLFFKKMFIWGVDGRGAFGHGLWQFAYASNQVLNATNYNAAKVAMKLINSDEDRRLGVNPSHIMVDPTNENAALTVFKAERDAAGATNINKGQVDIINNAWWDGTMS